MTARSIRRAAERKARKLAREAEKQDFMPPATAAFEPEIPFPAIEPDLAWSAPAAEPRQPDEAAPLSEPKTHTSISPDRLAANKANAQLSTGPRSAAGKEVSRLNAVKTGLTGRTVLLPTDDAAAYEEHVQRFLKELEPETPREHALAQALAGNAWRAERIFSLEMAIFARGRAQFAAQFEHEDPSVRPGLIELETYLAYEKQIRNLHIQEARLRRQREKDTAELRLLQKERIEKEKQDLALTSKIYLAFKHDNEPFDPREYGFDFSTDAIEDYLKGVRAAKRAHEYAESDLRAA